MKCAPTEENYQAFFKALVDDLLILQQGFQYEGKRYHLINVGMKGDLPYLAKTGNFDRHWLRAQRKDPSKVTVKNPAKPAGVCWLCNAGMSGCGPFEDFNLDCEWANSAVPEPWSVRPSALDLYHDPTCPERVFRPDIWHNYHGGVGKLFIASSLAECLSLVDATSKDSKIEKMNLDLKAWAQKVGNSMPHSGRFCSERIGLISYQVQPDANWSKHDDTRIYHKFLEDWLTQREAEVLRDPVLSRVLWAVRAINRVFAVLYQGGLWLTQDEAQEAVKLGRHWLRLYAEVAAISLKAGKLRFPIVVKHHMLDHHFRDLLAGSQHVWTWNCLADSVQMDEDFIGHTARLSRRVSPVSTAFRVIQRYLTRAMKTWLNRGAR